MIHRRDAMIRLGQIGLGSLSLPGLLRAQASSGRSQRPANGTARSCILIYLWGGPPQMDMWDPNPEAAEGIRSLFRPIATAIPGVQFSEEIPRFARHADKMAIIRSLTHPSNEHEPSVYRTLTGRLDPSLRVPRNDRKRADAPTAGSVVSYFRAQPGTPGTVTIPRPIGHEGVTYSGTYAGFLGPRHDPLEVAPPGESKSGPPLPLLLPAEVAQTRLQARRGLLRTLEDLDRGLQGGRVAGAAGQWPAARELDDFRDQAFQMLASSPVRKALDLAEEKQAVRDRYGANEWGQAILTARRLVEAGVRLVTISWMYIQKSGNVANVWDNHGPFEGKTGYEMLKAEYCLPSLDQGVDALLQDLSASGLLDETLVAMYGEFGRTPKINKNQGRDHWGACQSAVLFGGGVRGGQVHGASDRDSAYPKSDPVSPEDLLATMYYALGIRSDGQMRDQLGRPHQVVDGEPLRSLFE